MSIFLSSMMFKNLISLSIDFLVPISISNSYPELDIFKSDFERVRLIASSNMFK